MTIRDLFLGYTVSMAPASGEWAVSLVGDDGQIKVIATHFGMAEALALANVWLVLIIDDTEIRVEYKDAGPGVIEHIRQLLARKAAGDNISDESLPATVR